MIEYKTFILGGVFGNLGKFLISLKLFYPNSNIGFFLKKLKKYYNIIKDWNIFYTLLIKGLT